METIRGLDKEKAKGNPPSLKLRWTKKGKREERREESKKYGVRRKKKEEEGRVHS